MVESGGIPSTMIRGTVGPAFNDLNKPIIQPDVQIYLLVAVGSWLDLMST